MTETMETIAMDLYKYREKKFGCGYLAVQPVLIGCTYEHIVAI